MDTELAGWYWLALAIGLLVLEVFGVGGVFIGVSAGAVVVALLVSILDIEWELQLVLFGVFSLIGTAIFWRFFRVKHSDNETSKLNNRVVQLVGVRASLLIEIRAGRGKIQVQDALWTVACTEDLPVGTMVEVIGYEDTVLNVKKV